MSVTLLKEIGFNGTANDSLWKFKLEPNGIVALGNNGGRLFWQLQGNSLLPDYGNILIEMLQNKMSRLASDQINAVKQLNKWWNGSSQSIALCGAAGSGKTYLLAHFLKQVKPKPRSACFLAPTHKAKNILKSSLKDKGLNYECFTVAQALGKQPVLNDEGEESFTNVAGGILSAHDLVIIDESSMITTEDYSDLIYRGNRIIFVGDTHQLPPINELSSPAFSFATDIIPLTTIKRYSGHILNECSKLRKGVDVQAIYSVEPDNQSIIHLPENQWLSTAIDLFKSDEFEKDTAYCRIVAYRNAVATKLNKAVKMAIYGTTDFQIGQRLIATKPVTRTVSERNEIKTTILLNNSEEIIIVTEAKTVPVKELLNELVVPSLCLNLGGNAIVFKARLIDGNGEFDVILLQPDAASSKALIRDSISLNKEKRQNKLNAYRFLNCFGDSLSDPYAITVHKAQGSTFQNLFPVIKDITKPSFHKKEDILSEIPRLLYTAISRASERIYIY